jgi:aminoglycoside phosphotransferase family enzyme/predicted kinase
MTANALARQQALVAALLAQSGAAGTPAELHETHISWVLVAGAHAYKIKKAVRLDFLDFSTLAARRHFCREEVRLNARMAPGLYCGQVDITGTPERPILGGSGAVIESAVHMRAFPQEALWSERILKRLLGSDEIDRFAQLLASAHACAPVAAPGSRWGSAQSVALAGERNMDELAAVARRSPVRAELAELKRWRAGEARRLWQRFDERKARGAVRECHGDLHCANILTQGGEVMAFDCIEFDEALRWIDVLHDLAFTLMDLRQRGAEQLASRLLNAYLECTGDFEGLRVLGYYIAECALVRAKVALLHAHEVHGLLAVATQAAHPPAPALIVMHGCSGSGKSHIARRMVEMFGAVQVRSDVERRRMPGGAPQGYDSQARAAVYTRLGELSATILGAGFPAVVDACHLKQSERADCARLADAQGVPWLIVDVRASAATMRARIAHRRASGADPSEADAAVLAAQLEGAQPLTARELQRTVVLDSEVRFHAGQLHEAVRRLW